MSLNPDTRTGNKNLEETCQNFVAFFNAMDEVFFSVDRVNSKMIYISNSCEKLYGYKHADCMNNMMLWVDLVHPEDMHLAIQEDPILEKGQRVKYQCRMIRKDKSVRWVEKKIVPTLNTQGKLVRIDGFVRDITDEIAAQSHPGQNEIRYRQILEITQEGVWTVDVNDNTNFVNQKTADLLGFTIDEIMGKKPYDFMDKKQRALAKSRMKNRRAGIKENFDAKFIRRNGEEIWTNISTNPMFDSNGKHTGTLAMLTDITQRKWHEEVIKKSEANLRTIFDNTDSSYILFSHDMKIVSFNSLAQKYSEEQNGIKLEINQPIKTYFPKERWSFVKETLKKVATGQTVSYEFSNTKNDGSVLWSNVRWVNIKNSDDKSFGFLLINKDVTHTKLAMLEREKITNDLIHQNKHLEQFTYIISHNLRSPVANIMGLSEMLNENDLDDEIRNEVNSRISSSIKNIDTVIKDLNNILQARELLNEKKELVYFSDLMESIKVGLHDKIESEQAQFNCAFDEVDGIFTTPGYLYSIFYNLSSNSIKYRKTDVTPVLTIRSRKLKNKIELTFKDNGKGIDLEKNGAQLFGLYKRFDTSADGKGMGLFMVKTQVEALGGTINVKSKPGEGTEFIIQFDK
jgi:PAS domain S-box-containing protein